MHFAANALVGESMTNPRKYFHNNVANGLKLLDAAVECGVKKFVFSSTCATYGPPDRVPMTEDLPQRPINPYGESKLMFEKMLQWYQQIHGLEFIAFRYFNAAGASERVRRASPHRDRISSRTCCRSPWAGSRTARFTARIIPRPTAPASAITSTSSTWRRRTSSAWRPGRQGFYNLGNGDGYSVRAGHSDVREGHGQNDSGHREAAPPRRPAAAGGRRGQGDARTGVEAQIPQARRHRRHRLGLAPAASRRLPGLRAYRTNMRFPKSFTAGHTHRGKSWGNLASQREPGKPPNVRAK